ncbi:2-nonaprenyl-3-methyl-6-methoxy-1,4-benzoquinol hydroxylase [Hibiscus syriacus]|uniref:2-nonaprenyl-3-methyl-6-methoxy-1,4-benzoquinol hydroxylase n=1 Tax=Hibiscus syriacus TaxID=106335 RepID=A0A6A2Y6J9_HIBSY|nr:2-nonaprenyl-3-methyl-6-methoxy-1,4-benzoquinol hydroxylase [Hibiscus syriacus]
MSGGATRKAWMVAATIGGVEALKDQGNCREDYTIRSHRQDGKNSAITYAQATSLSSSAASYALMNESEVKMKKVMDLSCFGPNTIRF